LLFRNTPLMRTDDDAQVYPGGSLASEIGPISVDITKAKRAEEEIQQFFNLSLDMLCVAGYDGYFKRLNSAWQRMLGWTTEQLLSKPFLEFVHPDDRPATLEERDLLESYKLGVNGYVVKPVDFDAFQDAVRQIGGFWAMINEVPAGTLPRGSE
jgi:PAS domain-containing protein